MTDPLVVPLASADVIGIIAMMSPSMRASVRDRINGNPLAWSPQVGDRPNPEHGDYLRDCTAVCNFVDKPWEFTFVGQMCMERQLCVTEHDGRVTASGRWSPNKCAAFRGVRVDRRWCRTSPCCA